MSRLGRLLLGICVSESVDDQTHVTLVFLDECDIGDKVGEAEVVQVGQDLLVGLVFRQKLGKSFSVAHSRVVTLRLLGLLRWLWLVHHVGELLLTWHLVRGELLLTWHLVRGKLLARQTGHLLTWRKLLIGQARHLLLLLPNTKHVAVEHRLIHRRWLYASRRELRHTWSTANLRHLPHAHLLATAHR